jgi:hypothetical protein
MLAFRDTSTKIWSNAEGELNFKSGATTEGIFNFRNLDFADVYFHPIQLGNYAGWTAQDGNLIDSVAVYDDDNYNSSRNTAFAVNVASFITEDNYDTLYITPFQVSVDYGGEGRLRQLAGYELDVMSRSGRVRADEYDITDPQMTWGPTGLTAQTHNVGDMINEQTGFKSVNYLREDPHPSGQAGVTVKLSGYISTIPTLADSKTEIPFITQEIFMQSHFY